jgi:hypothetical protein
MFTVSLPLFPRLLGCAFLGKVLSSIWQFEEGRMSPLLWHEVLEYGEAGRIPAVYLGPLE